MCSLQGIICANLKGQEIKPGSMGKGVLPYDVQVGDTNWFNKECFLSFSADHYITIPNPFSLCGEKKLKEPKLLLSF